jgi:CRP-like cAMP-binding protein
VVSQQPPARLSPDFWHALQDLKIARAYAKGEELFRRDDSVNGLYVIESGEIRILLPSGSIGQQLVEVAGPGFILGLAECMSGDNYRVSAEASDRTVVAFVERDLFLNFLRDHKDFCMQVVRLLSEDLHGLYHKFRSICAHPGRPRHRSLDEQLH